MNNEITDTRLIGCFNLTVMESSVDDEIRIKFFHIVKNLVFEKDYITFSMLAPKGESRIMSDGEEFSDKLEAENMLQYFNRLSKEHGGIWFYLKVYTMDVVLLNGKFEYNNKGEIFSAEKFLHNKGDENDGDDGSNITPFRKGKNHKVHK
jgi:hypothetical protein